MQLGNRNKNIAMKSVTAALLVMLIAISSLADQGCNVVLRGGPPPPGTGQGGPGPLGPTGGTTTTNPPVTNPPTVAIITATTAEVNGYALDTANPTATTPLKVELLPGGSANNTNTQPLMTGNTDPNLTFPGLTQPGKGFRFTLSGPTYTTTTSIAVRATTQAGQVATTAERTLSSTSNTTTTTR